jgi:hypothetical protein
LSFINRLDRLLIRLCIFCYAASAQACFGSKRKISFL